MPLLSIQATDTVFFRDGRPFSMGDDSFAQGIFPPIPSVIFGALRSAFISGGLEEGQELGTLIRQSEDLHISFTALLWETDMYFPMPKDLLVPKSESEPIPLELSDAPLYSSAKTRRVLIAPESFNGKTEEEPHLISSAGLRRYLSGNSQSLSAYPLSNFLTKELKIGIGRDKESNTADSGKLFRLQSNRLSSQMDKHGNIFNLEFIVGYENLELPEQGWLTLGGERRVARFEQRSVSSIGPTRLDSASFKIYLATPAFFEKGWIPETLLGKYGLELLAVAVDRPLQVGGWDLDKRRPKPMVQCVPAGSVYYVRANSVAEANLAAESIHGQSISDGDKTNGIVKAGFREQGFGISYIGKM